MKKVMIAMSGGVDSSVAAYLMQKEGYECIGATMQFLDIETDRDEGNEKKCSPKDMEEARNAAETLRIPFEKYNFTKEFKEKVIEHFIRSYENGLTPNPCIECNRYLKFEKLLEKAEEQGCEYIATGHYAQIERKGARYLLKKGEDTAKDQSYMLYSLTQKQLSRTVFPLGKYRKNEIRKIAEQIQLKNAQKKESQDICFVPNGDYEKVIRSITGKEYPEGNFTDMEGNILGTHRGIIKYTIGQRKGLGLALQQPMYVCRKDTATNRVILAKNEELFTRSLDLYACNWIAYEEPPEELRAKVRIRYHHQEQWATIKQTGGDTVHIEFDEPQRAITPGQAAVIYDGDYVIGGGTIR